VSLGLIFQSWIEVGPAAEKDAGKLGHEVGTTPPSLSPFGTKKTLETQVKPI
jgi:hypothetical protein